MSYDISLVHPETKETVILDEKHYLAGGTYNLEGTKEAWLNVTFNYHNRYQKVFGPEGIKVLIGLTAKEAIDLVGSAISMLADDVDNNYWVSTEGNAKLALRKLDFLLNAVPPDSIVDIGY